VLVYVLDQDVHAATTTSLLVVAVASLAGGLAHASERRVCWPHTRAFAGPAIAGVAAGTVANHSVGGGLLLLLFVPVMAVAAYATWRNAASSGPEAGSAGDTCPPVQWRRDVAAGLIVGLLAGFFGVGGGFVVVPALALALDLPMRFAIGTSLVIVTVLSLVGLGAHLLTGQSIDAGLTIWLSAGCVVGSLAGVALAGRVSQPRLGRAFAVLVAGVAAYLLAAGLFLGGPPGSG
jgi:hypothetical protein